MGVVKEQDYLSGKCFTSIGGDDGIEASSEPANGESHVLTD